MNYEAGSLYPHRALLEEAQFTVCFNDYQDLMIAAHIGKDGYVRQITGYNTGESNARARYVSWAIFEIVWDTTVHRETGQEEPLARARMKMSRVCVCLSRRTEANLRLSRCDR